MEKINSLKLAKELKEAQLRHMQKMFTITSAGWLYSSLTTVTKDSEINEALDCLGKSLKETGGNVDSYLFGSLLITAITEVELYLVDVLYCIFKAFPKKIRNMKFDLSDILDQSNDEIIQTASERHINELMYKKPLEYLEGFCQIISINSKDIEAYWPNFVEAKARRDLGIHNNWVVNKIYNRKLGEVGLASQFSLGDPTNPDNAYMQSVYDNCQALIKSINEELDVKYIFKK